MSIVRPQEDEIRSLAYDLFERRGGEHGWDLADWFLAERAATFHKNYERLRIVHLENDHRIWLGPNPPQRCRFCRKEPPAVSFENDAHAMPHFLGNGTVYLRDECDVCNAHFGRYVEDHFGKLLGGARTLMTVHGKRGVPSYKTNDKQTRIDVHNEHIAVKVGPGDPFMNVNDAERRATFHLSSQPHVPLAVYKSLAKIAISVLPDQELAHFSGTLAWILDADHTRRSADFQGAFANVYVTPGTFPPRYGWVEIYRRRHPALTVPYAVLIVVMKNLTFQVYVPLCDKDQHLVGQKCEMPFVPAAINVIGFGCGETQMWRMPLASSSATAIPFRVGFTITSEITRTPGASNS